MESFAAKKVQSFARGWRAKMKKLWFDKFVCLCLSSFTTYKKSEVFECGLWSTISWSGGHSLLCPLLTAIGVQSSGRGIAGVQFHQVVNKSKSNFSVTPHSQPHHIRKTDKSN